MAKREEKRGVVALMITDTHLSEYNCELVTSIFEQSIEVAHKLDLKYIYHGGDLFTSRKAQPLSVLKTFISILRLLEKEDLTLRIIPGNHDKTDYKSEDSFLDVFTRYHNIEVITTYDYFDEQNCRIHMIPFFDEKTTYSPYLQQVQLSKSKSNVLLTHIAVDSVRNNDGSKVENELSTSAFSMFDLVFVGHYHNYQEIDHIVYFGSTHQHNFGEDSDKGYTVLYEDLTFDQHQFDRVPTYNTNIIDLEAISKSSLEKQIKEIQSSGSFERIKFKGSPEKIAATNKLISSLQAEGIKVEKHVELSNQDEIQQMDQVELLNFTGFSPETILIEFDNFVEEKELDDNVAKMRQDRLKHILIK